MESMWEYYEVRIIKCDVIKYKTQSITYEVLCLICLPKPNLARSHFWFPESVWDRGKS